MYFLYDPPAYRAHVDKFIFDQRDVPQHVTFVDVQKSDISYLRSPITVKIEYNQNMRHKILSFHI